MEKFTIETCELVGLKLGTDYEILTVVIIDEEMNFVPYGRFFRTSIQEIVDKERKGKSVIDIIKEEKQYTSIIQETRPLADHQVVYRLKKDVIDFDTAVECGFGIVRVLNGKYQGQYFLYNSENDDENVGFMLDVYLQIVAKNYDNKNLERYINSENGRMMLSLLQHSDDDVLFHKLDMAFNNKKGGNNIIPINHKQ